MPWMMFDTAIGPCGIAWSSAGVTFVQLPEATRARTQARLLAKSGATGPASAPDAAPPWVTDAVTRTRAHLEGRPQDLSRVPIDLDGVSPFAAKVYRTLQAVPPGSTVSYGELAQSVGSAGGARAIGRAMAMNPVPIVVPCHRVLAAAGKPGGFSAHGGVVTKERLLALEGFQPPPRSNATAPSLFDADRSEQLPYDGSAAMRHLAEADPVLGAHVARVGDFSLRLKQTEGVFDALAESIVYQQLSGKAAATIFGRVRALFPRGRLEPRALRAAKDADLRGAGLSRSKLAALRDLAERAAGGQIPTLAQLGRMDDEAIVDALTQVRGIGPWTVQMLLIFRLGRPDVLPTSDYGIKKGFAQVFHRGPRKSELPSDADLVRRAEKWRPFRSVASWYLWRAIDP